MNIPGYTANSDVNKLNAKFERIQRRIDSCNALLIARAVDHINEGNKARGLELLAQVRTSLTYTEDLEPANHA